MNTEKYILDDARQWFIVRKLKHVEDYETTYRHLQDGLSDSLSRVLHEPDNQDGDKVL